MIWDIICHFDSEEDFQPGETDAKEGLNFFLGTEDQVGRIRNDIGAILARNRCSPTSLAQDFLNIAMIVYSADKSVRRKWGYQRWERGLNIHAPIVHIENWQRVKSSLQDILHFLTDDRWRFYFRQLRPSDAHNPQQDSLFKSYSSVALLSGGLDSYIGAIDLLEKDDKPVAFVSHHGQSGPINTIQRDVLTVLNSHYPQQLTSFSFFVQPPRFDWEPEPSARSRSFLFLALAVAVASSTKTDNLYISENGFMSINAPLTRSRAGSHSTRTTHPNFLNGFQNLLDTLGLAISVENPYQFDTKGEMIETCANQQALRDGLLLTHSCSRSSYFRFQGHSPREHCGYCLPCLIRNAATHKAGVTDVNYLRTEKMRSAQKTDIWALNRLLRQFKTGELNTSEQVTKSGPIPDFHDRYAGVYERGLQELSNLAEQIL